ncbi:hypothetical protein CHISP_2702 [Chitinispirillum alkaliphilum]|nr:hypothetical protein CHISP_2702 [Chitinispirillum alkaliphilum]
MVNNKITFLCALLAAMLLCSGCYSVHTGTRLSCRQRKEFRENRMALENLTVGVVAGSIMSCRFAFPPPGADSYHVSPEILSEFVEDAQRTGVFKEVNYLDSLNSKPDIIISVKTCRRRYWCGQGGILGVFTLGLIPIPADPVDLSYTIHFYSVKSPAQLYKIEKRYIHGKMIWWFSPVVNILSPNRWFVFKRDRFIRNLGYDLSLMANVLEENLNAD